MVNAFISRNFKFVNRILVRRYLFLLCALVGLLSVPNFFYETTYQKIIANIMQSIAMLASAYAVHRSNKELYLFIIVCAIVNFVNYAGYSEKEANINFYLSFFFYMMFYLFVCYRLIIKILNIDKIGQSMLFASINIYLLLAICGGFIFMIIENMHPGSLYNLELENITEPSKFIYFSMVTLSTLGYGDIYPITPPAQSFCMLLAASGQIYLTFIVAMIVGRYLSNTHQPNE